MIDLFIEIHNKYIINIRITMFSLIYKYHRVYRYSNKKEDCANVVERYSRRSYRSNKHNKVTIMTRSMNGIHVLRKPKKLKNTRVTINHVCRVKNTC